MRAFEKAPGFAAAHTLLLTRPMSVLASQNGAISGRHESSADVPNSLIPRQASFCTQAWQFGFQPRKACPARELIG